MSGFDLSDTIIPRSDQLNSEDMLTGPRTVTVADVRKGSVEQPVDIHLVEFPGRPFKPSKTVRRILVAAWGPDANAYTGRRMTLYRDPAVRFGGQDVGGIRVSHLSHIEKPLTLALTVTRGKRAPYTVQPLTEAQKPAEPAADPVATPALLKALHEALTNSGLTDRDAALAYISQEIDRDIASTKELTKREASLVIDSLGEQPTIPEPELET